LLSCQTLVGCIDCAIARDRLQPAVSYSLQPDTGADYTVTNVEYRGWHHGRLWEQGKVLGLLICDCWGSTTLVMLAAVAVGRLLGLDFPVIAKSIATLRVPVAALSSEAKPMA